MTTPYLRITCPTAGLAGWLFWALIFVVAITVAIILILNAENRDMWYFVGIVATATIGIMYLLLLIYSAKGMCQSEIIRMPLESGLADPPRRRHRRQRQRRTPML